MPYTIAELVYLDEQGPSQLFQVDFKLKVGLSIEGGKLYDFFLNSHPNTSDASPFLHASNKKLSGTKQEKADDLILFFDTFATSEPYIYPYATGGPISPAGDKDSDINVQVFGTSDKKKSKPKQ